jgi:hypothetical protein
MTASGQLWARIYAFRTPIVAAVGPLLTALPDLLVLVHHIGPVMASRAVARMGDGRSTFAVIIMKAFETKPDGVKAA